MANKTNSLAHPHQLSILIVEDEPAHAEAIVRSLRTTDSDIDIQVVNTLQEYRHSIASQTPDIVVIDLNLPDGRAMDVLTPPPDASPFPVVVMTSYGNEKIAVEAMKAGALDYIVKSAETFIGMPRTIERTLREWNLIQERKQVEETLRESETQFRELWGATVEGITILDNGIIIEVNDAMCKLFGYTREQAIGKSLLEFTPAEMHDPIRKRIASGIEGSFETPALRADGARIILEAFAKKFVYQGKPMRMVATRDITERKQTEKILQEAIKEREKLIRELQHALENIKTLQGLIPMCSNCKKIRDDKGFWSQVEEYIVGHTNAEFTHGICPDCAKNLYGDLYEKTLKKPK
jgi:PAS domain S-box-containing protein